MTTTNSNADMANNHPTDQYDATNAQSMSPVAGHLVDPVNSPVAPKSNCCLVHGYFTQPSEDEEDDDEEQFDTVNIFTANSTQQAIDKMVQKLAIDGYRPLEEHEAEYEDDCPKWTDEWAVVRLYAFALDENDGWGFFRWPSDFWEESLINWAKSNHLPARILQQSAMAGNTEGHKALANHAGFLSTIEKQEIDSLIPVDAASGKSDTTQI